MHQISFYVPDTHLESVKQALFNAGAGHVDNYDNCCWQTLGTGQFRPNDDSKPQVGERNKINSVAEYKVELICADKDIRQVLQALVASHPYETPAYSAYPITTIDDI